jgi:hypothetical protein
MKSSRAGGKWAQRQRDASEAPIAGVRTVIRGAKDNRVKDRPGSRPLPTTIGELRKVLGLTYPLIRDYILVVPESQLITLTTIEKMKQVFPDLQKKQAKNASGVVKLYNMRTSLAFYVDPQEYVPKEKIQDATLRDRLLRLFPYLAHTLKGIKDKTLSEMTTPEVVRETLGPIADTHKKSRKAIAGTVKNYHGRN